MNTTATTTTINTISDAETALGHLDEVIWNFTKRSGKGRAFSPLFWYLEKRVLDNPETLERQIHIVELVKEACASRTYKEGGECPFLPALESGEDDTLLQRRATQLSTMAERVKVNHWVGGIAPEMAEAIERFQFAFNRDLAFALDRGIVDFFDMMQEALERLARWI